MKKLLALIFAALILISLVACKKTENNDNVGDNTNDTNIDDNIATDGENDTNTNDDEKMPDVPSSEGLEFSLSTDGTSYVVTGTGICIDTDIVIPSIHDDLPVTSVGNGAFSDFTAMTRLVIPNSVTTVGTEAFRGCSSLTSVFLGNSVELIDDMAFYGCFALKDVNIPSSVKNIGLNAFGECGNLIYSDYEGGKYLGSNNNPYRVLISVDDKTRTTYTINENTNIIYCAAFKNCENMVTITLPDSIVSVGGYAFRECSRLVNVNVGEKLESIGSSVFYYCEELKNINFPNSLKYIGDSAFYYCIKLSTVEFGNSLETIDESAFQFCYALESVTFPQSVNYIGNYAFNDCKNLKTIETLNPNIVIEPGFSKCPIERASVPAHIISSIANENLISIDIISGSAIEERAFCHEWGLCENLKEVTIAESVTSIAKDAFQGCVSLTSITVDDDNESYKSIDGNLYTKDGKTLVRYAIGKTDTDFSIPTSVITISDEAFYNGKNLINVVITDAVLSIGDNAFDECENLESVIIGKSVTVIGNEAFRWCESLTIFKFNGTMNEWRDIAKGKYWRNTNNYNYIPAGTVICSDGIVDL